MQSSGSAGGAVIHTICCAHVLESASCVANDGGECLPAPLVSMIFLCARLLCVREHAQAELRDLRRELQELLTVSLKGGPACTSDVAKAVLADLDDEGDTGGGEERAVRSVQVLFDRAHARSS